VRNIEKGAKLRISENETEGPHLARYKPHPNVLARRQAREAIAE
jgi:hypothetical protein